MSLAHGIREPPRISLAQAPTPLERSTRLGPELGLDLWIKRDDLTGAALSGNKVRKLEYLVAEAERQGATTLITCGGVNSNHARATAVAAAQRGLRAHLLLRGEDRVPPRGNLLLDRWVKATTTFVNAEAYAERAQRMTELAAGYPGAGYVIPEGGSNGLGALGYVRCAIELAEAARRQGRAIARVVHALGSGGTTAGLALGFSALELDTEVYAVAVMPDAAQFEQRIARIVMETVSAGWVSKEVAERARWTIDGNWVGRGYAETTPQEMTDLHRVAHREGLILDPVYTGKAFLPILRRALPSHEGMTVFLHTGGIFELFAYAEAVDRATRAE